MPEHTPKPPRTDAPEAAVCEVQQPAIGERLELRSYYDERPGQYVVVESWLCLDTDGSMRVEKSADEGGWPEPPPVARVPDRHWPHVYARLIEVLADADQPLRLVRVARPDQETFRRNLIDLLNTLDEGSVLDPALAAVDDALVLVDLARLLDRYRHACGQLAAIDAHLRSAPLDVLFAHPGPSTPERVRLVVEHAFERGDSKHLQSLSRIVVNHVEAARDTLAEDSASVAEAAAEAIMLAGWRPPTGWQVPLVDRIREQRVPTPEED